MNRFHHALEHGVEKLLRVLGIEVGEQARRTLDVGEQHGDLLALTLQGPSGDQDLIGEMPGRVMLGRGEGRIVCNGFEAMTALGAEVGRGRRLASAVGTDPPQRGCTLLAELRLSPVLVLALRAFHRRYRTIERAMRVTPTTTCNKRMRPSRRGIIRAFRARRAPS